MSRELDIAAHRFGDDAFEDCHRVVEYTKVPADGRNWDAQDLRLTVDFIKELDELNWFTDQEPAPDEYWRLIVLCNKHKPHKTSIGVFGPLWSPEQAAAAAEMAKQQGKNHVVPLMLSPNYSLVPIIYTEQD